MDKIYKFFIYTVLIFIIIIRVTSRFGEGFAPIPNKDTLKKMMDNREDPPFEVIKAEKNIKSPCANEYETPYSNANDDYIIVQVGDRGKWRRPRDEIVKPKNCVKYCSKGEGKNYNSYIEAIHSNYGVIKPNIYSHKPPKMLEVYGTDSKIVDTIPNPEELPYTKETRAEWTCQREWSCFDPNTLLNSHFI